MDHLSSATLTDTNSITPLAGAMYGNLFSSCSRQKGKLVPEALHRT
jgi:hypothetical protein